MYPTYLGDGVYAEWDGYHVVLKANDPNDPTDKVYLDRNVIIALMEYIQRVAKEIEHA